MTETALATTDTGTDDASGLGKLLRAAKSAILTRRAISPEAEALDQAVCELIEGNEGRRKKRGPDARDRLQQTASAFIGALLAVGRDKWVRHTTNRSAFKTLSVSFRNFDAVWRGMKRNGLIDHKPGHTDLIDAFGSKSARYRYETRFRATAALWDLAVTHGVKQARRHYKAQDTGRTGSLEPIALRDFSQWTDRGKVRGKPVKFNREAPEVRDLARDVERLNEFWTGVALDGGVHRGFTRIFNTPKATSEGFTWDMGGRLYSAGAGSYQTLSDEDRVLMTINGEAVAELDAQASQLTIFQAQIGEPLDAYNEGDPYQDGPLAAFPRDAVKAYITMSFGQGAPPQKWGQRTPQPVKACPIEDVAAAVHKAYPALEGLQDPCTWARLMFVESEAVFKAVLSLMRQNIPALPVHDSIIVPVSKVAQGCDALREGYSLTIRAEPRISRNPPYDPAPRGAHDYDF